jgi:hypothetical protein
MDAYATLFGSQLCGFPPLGLRKILYRTRMYSMMYCNGGWGIEYQAALFRFVDRNIQIEATISSW